ncbi:Polyketide cyclase / dehydrase and lipid transport [Anatilimnocola aggregata]|uniref:Polyketide cyclase / dehydrase and lipid transport n=1 Tax=Anatilimnocola aggregata TaxID=2528021 RepID=A0A517YM31_9BACT|nr:SRPBCC family protein [Anatilimnocola aggregata]QDU31279.1 Polyketide cyclase / dehydrase and lipid transport [Anatilimnocola aggregata]
MSSTYVLERAQLIPRSRDEVFAFFADAGNLQMITPPWLHFRILTQLPLEMRTGALIEYRLRLYGLPIWWRTRIEEYEPCERFVDRQLRGPYKRWHHTHEFSETPAGTLMKDTVRYQLPFGPLGTLTHRLTVQRLLKRIFDFRYETIERHFAAAQVL